MEIKNLKNKLFSQNNLTKEESLFLFEAIMNGQLTEIEISSILTCLKIKGETKEEILGATKIMRSKSLKISSSDNTVDTCGTGGDMSDTLNISTAASLVAASCGIKIAKHGNKSVSSKSGSADMLENIGYKFSDDPKTLEDQLKKNNFCFMFAQYHHSAMKHVINVRKTLVTRTIFNLLGPLTNPANTKNQLLGVYDKKWLNTHCEVLKDLGSKNVRVNAISLGPMRTLSGAAIKDARYIYNWSLQNNPLGKNITFNDLKGSSSYLLSDQSSGVTGEIHYVDGGYNIIGMIKPPKKS